VRGGALRRVRGLCLIAVAAERGGQLGERAAAARRRRYGQFRMAAASRQAIMSAPLRLPPIATAAARASVACTWASARQATRRWIRSAVTALGEASASARVRACSCRNSAARARRPAHGAAAGRRLHRRVPQGAAPRRERPTDADGCRGGDRGRGSASPALPGPDQRTDTEMTDSLTTSAASQLGSMSVNGRVSRSSGCQQEGAPGAEVRGLRRRAADVGGVVEHRERDAGAEAQDAAAGVAGGPRPPLTTVPTTDLRLLMLEDDGRTRKITTKGVAWRARQ
jgi:hypothetical protein